MARERHKYLSNPAWWLTTLDSMQWFGKTLVCCARWRLAGPEKATVHRFRFTPRHRALSGTFVWRKLIPRPHASFSVERAILSLCWNDRPLFLVYRIRLHVLITAGCRGGEVGCLDEVLSIYFAPQWDHDRHLRGHIPISVSLVHFSSPPGRQLPSSSPPR
jgi:hypothetical protein